MPWPSPMGKYLVFFTWFLSTLHPASMKCRASTLSTLPFVTLNRDNEVLLDSESSMVTNQVLLGTYEIDTDECLHHFGTFVTFHLEIALILIATGLSRVRGSPIVA